MALSGKKIGILLESDYYENEIWYYSLRFPEEGAEVHFLSRLWGQERLTFEGHEYKVPIECSESFENMEDNELASYSAIIIPSGMVADRLRYSEDVSKTPPAAEFVKRAYANPNIVKGVICHGLWLLAFIPEVVRGRKMTVHNNMIADLRNMGGTYVDDDVYVDGDLVTGRTGGHCHMFARKIIEILAAKVS